LKSEMWKSSHSGQPEMQRRIPSHNYIFICVVRYLFLISTGTKATVWILPWTFERIWSLDRRSSIFTSSLCCPSRSMPHEKFLKNAPSLINLKSVWMVYAVEKYRRFWRDFASISWGTASNTLRYDRLRFSFPRFRLFLGFLRDIALSTGVWSRSE
jgi:hypothetical protein